MSFEIDLHFPKDDQTVDMPAVPRIGERIEWYDRSGECTEWEVTEVTYSVDPRITGPGRVNINVTVDPPGKP